MKKFLKNITLVLLLLVSATCVFAGCQKPNDPNVPSSTDRVYGNGGLAVTKGQYLYFLNGYRTYSNVKTDDDNKNVVRGAIYKTKLSATGDLTLDEDGNIVDSSVERVVDRIACFENGGLYIVGNYLYYATPNTQDNSVGQILNNYVDYCRVNLSNPSDEQVLYTSEGSVTNGEWAVYQMDGGIYLVINTGNKIVCVKDGNKKSVTTMASDVTSAEFWNNEDNHTLSENEQYIYYTRNVKSSDKVSGGNVLAKVKIGTSKEIPVVADGSTSYEVVDVANNNVYYKKGTSYIYKANASDFKNELKLTYTSYDKVYHIENTDVNSTLNRTLVYTATDEKASEGSKTGRLSYYDNGSVEENVVLDKVDITILDVVGNIVYFYQDSTIYKVDILSKEVTKLINGDNAFSFNTSQNMCFDVDGNYMYFLNGYTPTEATVYYLSRVDLSNPKTHTFLGEFVSSEAPEVSEEE